jgi:hypothetical protein
MMKGIALALLALAASTVGAADHTGGTWSVRVLYLDLETRVGTVTTSRALEYEVAEAIETGYPREGAAELRAASIARGGFTFDAGGRLQVVPAHRVERVEVYAVE